VICTWERACVEGFGKLCIHAGSYSGQNITVLFFESTWKLDVSDHYRSIKFQLV
jgi:hypothetical protein